MRLYLICGLAVLSGCAHIRVDHVDAKGAKSSGQEEGFYVPRLMPYLIVMDLPPKSPTGSSGNGQQKNNLVQSGGGSGPSKPSSGSSSQKSDSGNSDNSSTKSGGTPGSASDLGFGVETKQYVAKLVYLPDFSHQQVISASAGLFGTVSLAPQLQDGALVSLNGSADNSKMVDVLTALISAGTSAASGGASGAASAASKAAQNKSLGNIPAPSTFLLPGLYRFEYNEDGFLIGLRKMTGFCDATGKYGSVPKEIDRQNPDNITRSV